MRQANNGSHPYTLGCIISLVNACDKYAAVGGSDSAEGTDSAPFRTAQRLVDSLKPGQTGCLRSGTYTEADDTLTISGGGSFGRRVVIRSVPGERTTFLGRVYITEAGDYVTLRNLVLDGSYGPKCASGETCSVLPSPTVNGDHAHLIGNDISNRRAGWEATLAGSCINVGDSEVKVKETLIENNRIHDCGRIPSSNHDQGIYLTSSWLPTQAHKALVEDFACGRILPAPASLGPHLSSRIESCFGARLFARSISKRVDLSPY